MAGRILVVDGRPTGRVRLKARLIAGGFAVAGCADARQAAAMLKDELPDLVIATGDLEELKRVIAAAEDSAIQPVPVVSLGLGGIGRDRLAALEAGAEEVFPPDVPDMLFFARLKALVRALGLRMPMPPPAFRDRPGLREGAAGFVPLLRLGLVGEDARRCRGLQRLPGVELCDAGEARVDAFLVTASGPRCAKALTAVKVLRSRRPGVPVLAVLPRKATVLAALLFDAGLADMLREEDGQREWQVRIERAAARARRSAAAA